MAKMTIRAVRLTAMAAAVLAAYAAYGQEDEELAELTRPASALGVGVGYVSDDNLRFGQYTGLKDEDVYLLFDADAVRRNDATGTWLRLRGRNLGLDSRELRFDHERQGNWRYFIDFSQTPRFSPYIANTTLGDIDTGTQLEGAEPARDVRLRARRDAFTLGAGKTLGGGWDAAVRFRHEEKTGTRLFGRHAVRFLVDPIDYTTKQLDATVGYTGERLQLSGGYYGTDFRNPISSITASPTGVTPIALPPDNHSHQLHVSGGYSFTPTTRGMFKVAHGRIIQEERFFLTPIASVPRDNLGGRIDTTLLQAGLSTRPIPGLSLRADLRHEERDDKTPVHIYVTPPAAGTHTGENEPRSFKTTVGKIDAGYALPMRFHLIGGVEHDRRKRNTSVVRSVSHRDETEENTYRIGLRRMLGETVNGAIAYERSERSGSDWLNNILGNGTPGSNLIHPVHLADRDRDKVRLSLDWMPIDPLSVTFVGEVANDDYSGRTLGVREGRARFLSLDAAYRLSEAWTATAWASRSDTRVEQVTCNGAPASNPANVCPVAGTSGLWEARLRNLGDAIGVGLRGKPTSVLETGADVVFTSDRGEFRQTALTGGVAAVTPTIPDVNYDRISLSLHGAYALSKASGVRLLYIFDRFKTDDWYWTNFVYGDGTTVRQDPDQKVHFIGLSYYFRFQ
jgi:MtrB/PioB family decaheme-associated outer membrane protein